MGPLRSHVLLESALAASLHRLVAHPLLQPGSIRSVEELRLFMEHHVYAVLDFMSLVKSLQHLLVPSGWYWAPSESTRHSAARFINEIVLAEETDEDGRGGYQSHFDLYLEAMREVGADTAPVEVFAATMAAHGPAKALQECTVPEPAREFMAFTFGVVGTRRVHRIAAAFAYGREHVIPEMFRRLLAQLATHGQGTERFRRYLERHIALDDDEHGPMAQQMVSELCDEDVSATAEVVDIATQAINARIRLWDQVLALLK